MNRQPTPKYARFSRIFGIFSVQKKDPILSVFTPNGPISRDYIRPVQPPVSRRSKGSKDHVIGPYFASVSIDATPVFRPKKAIFKRFLCECQCLRGVCLREQRGKADLTDHIRQ